MAERIEKLTNDLEKGKGVEKFFVNLTLIFWALGTLTKGNISVFADVVFFGSFLGFMFAIAYTFILRAEIKKAMDKKWREDYL